MSSTRFRAIIFDIGRVLIRVDIARAMDGLASGLSLTPQDVWSAIEKDPRWLDWQEGRISPLDWHLHLNKRLGTSLTFEEFSEVWNRALDPKPIHSEAFLEKLSKNYRLALLSNTDPIHMSHEEARFPFFRFFAIRIYSYQVGASICLAFKVKFARTSTASLFPRPYKRPSCYHLPPSSPFLLWLRACNPLITGRITAAVP